MRKWKLSIALLMVTILITSASAVLPVGAAAIWKDITPNAYLSPPENPPLDSVYMFPAQSPVEGWAVGDAQPTTDATRSLPSIFHYDGSVWNLVSAPKYPDFPATQCPYDLTSVNFGPPNNAISKNDGWAVGFSLPIPGVTAVVTATDTATTTSSATATNIVSTTISSPFTTATTITAATTVTVTSSTPFITSSYSVTTASAATTVTSTTTISATTTSVTGPTTVTFPAADYTVSSTVTVPNAATSTVTVPTVATIPGTADTSCARNSVAIHWDGVTWRVQVAGLTGPSAGPLNSIFMVSSTDAWAVGSNQAGTAGTIWHWTGVPGLGGGWNLVMTVPQVLRSVFMVSATDGWAVGDNGAIYHYFAGAWTAFASPFPPCVGLCSLTSVFMISPTDGWIVGTNGIILHYTAGTWSGPVSPGTTTNTLFSVFMSSSTEGWAVGGGVQCAQCQATIVHYSGGTWTALPINLIPLSPVNSFSLNSVFFTTAADGWAVGTAGAIIHFDGTNWGSVTSPTLNNFTSIHFGPPLTGPINPNDGWAVGNASATQPFEPTIYHWNGFQWTKGVAIGATNNLNSVYMLNGGDVWAVGGGPHPTASCSTTPIVLCPIILHFTGGSWNTVTPPPGAYALKSVFMVSPSEGWAVGEQATSPPTGIILHYTVTGGVGTWAIFPAPSSPSPPGSLNSVFLLGPNEGWAVGDEQTILHYTVTGGVGTWNAVTVSGTPTLSKDANLTSIFMLSPTSGWAVGGVQTPPAVGSSISAGPVIIYWDGTKWTPVATPSIPGGFSPAGHNSATLKSVFCSGPSNCWAAGFPGKLFATLLHWDGVAWNHVSTIPALIGQVPPILTSIYLTDPGSGWIVGSDPEFPYPSLAQTQGGTEALSTILQALAGAVTGTVTTTVVSTVSTQTTFLTGITTTYSTVATTVTSTNTTVIQPTGGNIIPAIVGIVAVLAVGLVVLLLLLSRRRPKPPVLLYPIPRRP